MTLASYVLAVFQGISWVNTAVAVLVGTVLVTYGLKWRSEMRRRLAELAGASSVLEMRRGDWSKARSISASGNDLGSMDGMAREIEVNAEYASSYQTLKDKGLTVRSLGDYLSVLEPVDGSRATDEQMETLLGGALLKFLGPTAGPALLPALGMLPGSSLKAGMAALERAAVFAGKTGKPAAVGHVTSLLPSHLVKAVGGISVMTMSGFGDVSAQILKSMSNREKAVEHISDTEDDPDNELHAGVTPVDVTWRGEIRDDTFAPDLIPNPFVVSEHWDAAIEGIEATLSQEGEGGEGGTYDPDDRPSSPPVPVGDKSLPDLHLGFGDVKQTHTNREVLQNRLFSILLNRLSMNDILDEVSFTKPGVDRKAFEVKVESSGPAATRPCHLMELLQKAGHTFTCTAASRTTAFGLALCVKERNDDGWSHIPLGVCLRTGVQDKNGDSVPTFLTHSSVDLGVRGPKVNVDIQYYHSQEGWSAWQSGHYPDVPWAVQAVERPLDAIRAVRVAGFNAACLNSVASRHSLPMAGYGLLGVCNDSAAIVEQTIAGQTGIYPCIALGGYFVHVLRRATELRGAIVAASSDAKNNIARGSAVHAVLNDLDAFKKAMYDLPNDIHPTPATTKDTLRRIVACTPPNAHLANMLVGKKMAEDLLSDPDF